MFGIGYINTRIEPCTKEKFYEKADSKAVKDMCALIKRMQTALTQTTDAKRIAWCKTRISEGKKALPVITPLATFKNGKRSSAEGIPSGLNMLDVDHVDNPLELWENIKAKLGEEGMKQIALVHMTPSTKGLRILFKHNPAESYQDEQKNFAFAVGCAHDGVTHDLARCSFMVPRDYIYYTNEELLFSGFEASETTGASVQNQGAEQPSASTGSAPKEGDAQCAEGGAEDARKTYPADFKGVPYADIIERILAHAGYPDMPAEGERNNALYVLCRNLRYVCDFNTDFIVSVLPDWQLPEAEVIRTVDNAVKSVRMATMPAVLRSIVADATKSKSRTDDPYFSSPLDFTVDDGGLIGEFVKLQPKAMATASYLAAMVCFGTLLTKLRGHGMNGDVVAPNFMLCVSAPQATGKSFMKHIYEQVLRPVREEDKRQRKILQDIEHENKKNANKEDYEEKKFEGAIRCLSTNTSNRVLIERMDLAKEQHLMFYAEEIDSITKAEKSGKWSEKSDIYRLAYDNSEWGMDYASDNSYKAVVKLYLNLLFSGTPAAVSRFFSDIENGLITRFLFVDLPDNYGTKRPKRKHMSDETQVYVNDRIDHLYRAMQHVGTEDGFHWIDTSKMVEDTDEGYDEVQRRMFLCNQSEIVRDLARRRYADYAIKMMMIETYLNDGVYTEAIRDRVLGVVGFCTEQLIASYGDKINASISESLEKHEEAKRRDTKVNVLDSCPDTFTTAEYVGALKRHGFTANSSGAFLKRLVKGGLIEMVSRGLYQKSKG